MIEMMSVVVERARSARGGSHAMGGAVLRAQAAAWQTKILREPVFCAPVAKNGP